MANVDYKTKFLDIRNKLLESTDVAYRLGFEEGLKEGAQQAEQQMQQEQEQQMAEEQQAMMGAEGEGAPAPGAEGEMPGEEGEAPLEEFGDQDSGNMDEHIAELESLVAKGEKPTVLSMRKAVKKIASLRKTQKKPNTKILTAQKEFVNSIVKSFEAQTKDVTEDIEDIIKEHGLTIPEEK